MRNTGQHNNLSHYPEAHSLHTSMPRVTPETMPGPEQLLSAMSSRTSVGTGNASNSQVYSPPRLSGTRHIPLPPTIQGPVELNPLLRSSHRALIRYSLVAPPTTASAFGTNGRWMLEAATRPTMRSMTIAASDVIPWPIIAHASSVNPSVVTVGDVLTAVHNALYTLVTEREYGLVLLPNILVTGVMGNRYWNGMRRLDLVNDRHWWAGLSKSPEGPEIWDLHLQR